MNEKKTTIGQEPIRDARQLGLPRMLVLGLQHMFAMFGATVLVPILVQGYGKLGSFDCATATMLRFGGKSRDEFFVSSPAAAKGVTITNNSACEPLVLLKHFPVYDGVPQ